MLEGVKFQYINFGFEMDKECSIKINTLKSFVNTNQRLPNKDESLYDTFLYLEDVFSKHTRQKVSENLMVEFRKLKNEKTQRL